MSKRRVPWARVFLAGDAQGQQGLVAGVGGVGEDRRGLAGLRVAAEAPAAGGLGQRRQQDERLLGAGEVEDDVAAGEQARVAEAGLPEGDAALVGQASRQEPGGFGVAAGAALLDHLARRPGWRASPCPVWISLVLGVVADHAAAERGVGAGIGGAALDPEPQQLLLLRAWL